MIRYNRRFILDLRSKCNLLTLLIIRFDFEVVVSVD